MIYIVISGHLIVELHCSLQCLLREKVLDLVCEIKATMYNILIQKMHYVLLLCCCLLFMAKREIRFILQFWLLVSLQMNLMHVSIYSVLV